MSSYTGGNQELSPAPPSGEINYFATPTGYRFHSSDKFYRGIRGPVGSGKSVMCAIEILRRAQAQAPDKYGIRRTRFAIIRNTYRELLDTTIKTFHDWVPENIGVFSRQDMSFTITQIPGVECEILFRALDRPDDAKKLLSLELTAAWVNEAREIPRSIIDLLATRVGRFPPKYQTGGPTWYGIWMDTNPPDDDSWWYEMFEETRPGNAEQFTQPSGLHPDAENIENLPPNYYGNIAEGKNEEWVKIYVKGEYGFISEGKPVYPEYQDNIHCKPCPYIEGAPIILGCDWGLTPAAIFLQKHNYQWRAFREVVFDDGGAATFGKEVGRILRGDYAGSKVSGWGDPSGDSRVGTDERTVYDIMDELGIPVIPTDDRSNDPLLRREAVAKNLTLLTPTGEPGLVIDPACKRLRKSVGGGFSYKRVQVSGKERYTDKPAKDIHSHCAEALEYALLGEGEGYNIINRDVPLARFGVKHTKRRRFNAN